MKKINWKIRFKNPQFIAQVVLAVAMPIGTYFGLAARDMTTWKIVFDTLLEAVSNPYIVIMIIASVYNAVNDPTVRGLSDSERALGYQEPIDNKTLEYPSRKGE